MVRWGKVFGVSVVGLVGAVLLLGWVYRENEYGRVVTQYRFGWRVHRSMERAEPLVVADGERFVFVGLLDELPEAARSVKNCVQLGGSPAGWDYGIFLQWWVSYGLRIEPVDPEGVVFDAGVAEVRRDVLAAWRRRFKSLPDAYFERFEHEDGFWTVMNWWGVARDVMVIGCFFVMVRAFVGVALNATLVARARQRVRGGHCPRCDYDLRGVEEVGCPECGWERGGVRA